MSDEPNVKGIVFDLIAKHGLTVIALGFLGWFIINQTERQYQETQHWRQASLQVSDFQRQNAERFYLIMDKIHQQMVKVENACHAKILEDDVP